MNTRRKIISKFKTKVALEPLSECRMISELTQKHGLHPNQISRWKQEFLASVEIVFEKGSVKKHDNSKEQEKLYKIIGELKS